MFSWGSYANVVSVKSFSPSLRMEQVADLIFSSVMSLNPKPLLLVAIFWNVLNVNDSEYI